MRRAIIISILFGLVAGVPSTGLSRSGIWDRNAVYAARVAALKMTITQHPDDPRPLVALAAFYLKPLQNLAGRLKNDPRTKTNPAMKSKWYLATAIYLDWIGELNKSAGTAVAALRIDPTNLDALDYVVDILRNTHTYGKMRSYKAILNRWEGADSTPVIVKAKPRGPRR